MWAVSKLEAGGGVVALQVSVKVDKEVPSQRKEKHRIVISYIVR